MQEQKRFVECNKENSVNAKICPECGIRKINSISETFDSINGKRNGIVVGIFAMLLGYMGIHKFYLGQITKGIFYILFCCSIIP